MRAQDYLSYPILDIIFEGRNKSYGAYALRMDYDKSVRKALVIGVLFVISAVMSPLIYAKIMNLQNSGKTLTSVEVTLSTYEIPEVKAKPEIPPKKEEAPKPPKDTRTYLPPVVNIDDAVTEKPMTPPGDITTEISNIDSKGTGDPNLPNAGVGAAVEPPQKKPTSEPIIDEIPIVVEQQAEFPDGIQALYKWLGNNIKYPTVCRENGIQGKVVVRFVVEKNGQVTNAQVVREVHELLNEEALRVVKQMPKWKPGKQSGNAVRSYFTLPIKFALE
jgi:protein TonB